jgi:hypothetical protein
LLEAAKPVRASACDQTGHQKRSSSWALVDGYDQSFQDALSKARLEKNDPFMNAIWR